MTHKQHLLFLNHLWFILCNNQERISLFIWKKNQLSSCSLFLQQSHGTHSPCDALWVQIHLAAALFALCHPIVWLCVCGGKDLLDLLCMAVLGWAPVSFVKRFSLQHQTVSLPVILSFWQHTWVISWQHNSMWFTSSWHYFASSGSPALWVNSSVLSLPSGSH